MANFNGLLFCLLACMALTAAAELECPEVDEDVILYPNPANCSTFFQCYNGSAVEKSCPDGLIYNPELLVCDWPWAYECVETPATLDFNPDGNVELITVPPPVCPPPGSEVNATFFVNVYNCSTYYTCESGELTPRNCPPGLHFNPLIGVCDFPQAANCKEIIPAVPATHTILVPSKPFSSKLDPACNPNGPPTCPPPPSVGNVTVCPNPYNCSNYYYCDNGVPKIRDCPPDLEYNAELGVCDFVWAANCVELPSPIEIKPKQKLQRLSKLPAAVVDPACNPNGPPTCPPPPSVGNVTVCPNPYNCSNYYYCDNGVAHIRDCPLGLEYNAELGVCDYTWAANCVALPPPVEFDHKMVARLATLKVKLESLKLSEVAPVINDACSATGPPNCPPPGTLGNVTNCPNPYNCSNYYYCDNGVAKIRDCPPDLVYNSLTETCDFKWAANCVAIPPPVEFEDKMVTLAFLKVKLDSLKLSEVAPVINDACSATGPPNCLPPGSGGNVTNCPNPYNCSNYYYCDNGVAKMRDCPPGLEYSSLTESCDYTWAANCVALPPPVEFEDKMAARLATLKVKLESLKLSEVAPVINDACSATGPPNCPLPGSGGNVTNCPNPYNCSNYYYCDNGVAKMRDCPPGLEYSSLTESCDFKWAANCVAIPPPVEFEETIKVVLENKMAALKVKLENKVRVHRSHHNNRRFKSHRGSNQ